MKCVSLRMSSSEKDLSLSMTYENKCSSQARLPVAIRQSFDYLIT